MRSTGETAFVGFGSTVIRSSDNAAVQAKLNLESQKIASARAKDALCGLIIGDQSTWQGSVVESQKVEVQEFDEAKDGDPLAAGASGTKLEVARQNFVARLQTSDAYLSARKGVLPPGVTTKTWNDEDHSWAYAMSVYVPSVTNAASAIAAEMRNANIVQPNTNASNTKIGGGSSSSTGFLDENNQNIPRPGKEVKQGPTGKASDDDL